MNEIFDFDKMKENFDLELEKAKEHLEEQKELTPKPKKWKKLTTLSDEEERSIIAEINVKEEVLEILNLKPGVWLAEIKRITLGLTALKLKLEEYKVKEEKEE